MSTTIVRIFCKEPFHSEARFEEIHGKSILNVLGRAYEGYLARGEGAQVIKALSKLGKDDNEGTILCAPKLANYLLRVVTERLAHFTYKMNQTNDKVENQRWGKNGLKLTEDMLNNSTAHEEVYRLSQLLSVLTLASHHYADVHFVREDWDTAMASPADVEIEDDEDEDEEDEPTRSEPVTTQRRDLMESRKFGRVLVMRALQQPEEKQNRIIDLNELMDEDEIEQWQNSQDKAMLVHTVKEIVHMFEKPAEAVSLLVNLTNEQRASIKSPFAGHMFYLEGPQKVWPKLPTGRRRSLDDAKSMVNLIRQRAAKRTSAEQTIIMPIETFLEGHELSNWELRADKCLLINSLQASLAGSGQTPESEVPVLRNLTFAEIQEHNLQSDNNMFALEQPLGHTVGKIVELILLRARDASPLKAKTFLRIQNFMTPEELEIYSEELETVRLAVLVKLEYVWSQEDDITTFWNSCSLRELHANEFEEHGYGADQTGEVFVLEREPGRPCQSVGEVNHWPANDPAV